MPSGELCCHVAGPCLVVPLGGSTELRGASPSPSPSSDGRDRNSMGVVQRGLEGVVIRIHAPLFNILYVDVHVGDAGRSSHTEGPLSITVCIKLCRTRGDAGQRASIRGPLSAIRRDSLHRHRLTNQLSYFIIF
jgi:hypothetical protein